MAVTTSSATSSYLNRLAVPELTQDSQQAEQPKSTDIQLRPHQLTLLQKCREFESHTTLKFEDYDFMSYLSTGKIDSSVGIIGDMVGSGKSFVILAMVCEDEPPESSERDKNHRMLVCSKVMVTLPKPSCAVRGNTLLVIPHNLAIQWEQYIKSFCPSLSHVILNRSNLITNLNIVELFSTHRLVVVTATFYNRLAHMMRVHRVAVNRLVFDEADSLRIPACCTIENAFTWFVTATYGNLLYPKGYLARDRATSRNVIMASGLVHSGYIRSIFSELWASELGRNVVRTLVVRNCDDFVKDSIRLPEIQQLQVLCSTPHSIRVLYGYVSTEIINRLNAGDVDGALQCVSPGNRMSTQCIVEAYIKKYEEDLVRCTHRREVCESAATSLADTEDSNMFQSEVTKLTRKIEDLKRKVEGIRERIANSSTCSICLDVPQNKTVVKCCAVAFCFECITRWVHAKSVCPLCKQDITTQTGLTVVDDSSSSSVSVMQCIDGVQVDPSKDKRHNLGLVLRHRLDTDPNSRFLVCSSYDGSFDSMTTLLKSMAVSFSYLKGNSAQINSIIRQYAAGTVRVLLVNGVNYGSGMDLSMTTDVVMFHKFENELQKQVVGRAQRYGRTSTLKLWYFMYQNEHQQHAATRDAMP